MTIAGLFIDPKEVKGSMQHGHMNRQEAISWTLARALMDKYGTLGSRDARGIADSMLTLAKKGKDDGTPDVIDVDPDQPFGPDLDPDDDLKDASSSDGEDEECDEDDDPECVDTKGKQKMKVPESYQQAVQTEKECLAFFDRKARELQRQSGKSYEQSYTNVMRSHNAEVQQTYKLYCYAKSLMQR